jgi:TPR repeat protein
VNLLEIGRGKTVERFVAVVALVVGLLAIPAWGSPLYEVDICGKLGDCASAFKEKIALATSGNAFAQYYVGWMYNYGIGVKDDTEQALYWYHRAADLGNVKAMRSLGNLYDRQGTAKTDVQACIWYRRAVELGDADAMADLAYMYASAKCVTWNEADTQAISEIPLKFSLPQVT